MKSFAFYSSLLIGSTEARWRMGKCPKLTRESFGELVPTEISVKSFKGDWFV